MQGSSFFHLFATFFIFNITITLQSFCVYYCYCLKGIMYELSKIFKAFPVFHPFEMNTILLIVLIP